MSQQAGKIIRRVEDYINQKQRCVLPSVAKMQSEVLRSICPGRPCNDFDDFGVPSSDDEKALS